MAFGVTEELKIVVRAEVDRAVSGLQNVQRQTTGIEKNMAALGKAALKYLGPAFLVGAITKAGRAAVMAAASYEKLNVQLKVLMGSSQAADKMFANLRQFAAKTPLQLEQLVQSATQLLNVGVASNEMIATLTKLGDAAMGQADKLDTVVRAYGRVRQRGRATLEELNMLTEAGIPIIEELAKQLEITKEELFDFISAGKVGFDDLNDAITAMTTGEGKLAGMMEEQAQTLLGVLSTAKDAIRDLAAAIGTELLDSVKDVLTTFTSFVNKITEALGNTRMLTEYLRGGPVGTEGELIAIQEQIAFVEKVRARKGRTALTRGTSKEIEEYAISVMDMSLPEREAELVRLYERKAELERQVTTEKKEQTEETKKQVEEVIKMLRIYEGTSLARNVLDIGETRYGQARFRNQLAYPGAPYYLPVRYGARTLLPGAEEMFKGEMLANLTGGMPVGGYGIPYSEIDKGDPERRYAGIYGPKARVGAPGLSPTMDMLLKNMLGGAYHSGFYGFGVPTGYAAGQMPSPITPTSAGAWAEYYSSLYKPPNKGRFVKGKGPRNYSRFMKEGAPLTFEPIGAGLTPELIEEMARKLEEDFIAAVQSSIIDIGVDAFYKLGEAIGSSDNALQALHRTIGDVSEDLLKTVGLLLAQYGIATAKPGLIATGLGMTFVGGIISGWRGRTGSSGSGNVTDNASTGVTIHNYNGNFVTDREFERLTVNATHLDGIH